MLSLNLFSQFQLADLLNISQRAYSKIENGETELKIDRLQKIAYYLNVNIAELLGVLTLEKPKAETNNLERNLYEKQILRQEKEIEFLKGLVNVFKG